MPQRRRFPTQIAAKAGPVPTYQRFGSNNHENRKDRRKPAIELNEEPAVVVREMSAALQLTPQDHQLMSERGILSLQPDLRLEWRGQDRQDKTQEPDHSASLGDSITSATRIRFSVHTRLSVQLRTSASWRDLSALDKFARHLGQ